MVICLREPKIAEKTYKQILGGTVDRREEYRRYLQSAHWRRTRQQALLRAGHKCEFSHYRGDQVESCNRTQNLEVHHKHYKSLGCEQPDDLLVLCEYHHKVTELMKWECRACGEAVVDRDVAGTMLENIGHFDDFTSLRGLVGQLCGHCQNGWEKD